MSGDGAAAIFILIFASLDMAGWARGLPVPLFLIRATWWILSLGVVSRLVQQFGIDWIRWLVRRQPLLLVILAIGVLSSTWSLAPSESLHESLSLICTTLIGAYIGYALSSREFERALSVAFGALIVANLAALPVLPDRIVIEPLTHQWRGLADHKNSLGAIAAFALLFYAARLCRRSTASPWRAALSGASAVALLLSRSVTSLLAAGAGAASLAWSFGGARVRRAPRRTRVLLLAALAVAFAAAALSIGPITRALGRDATFNGRTKLWAASLEIIRERPLTGYGYHAVWRKQDASLLPNIPVTTERSATSAHNVVLNTATELGVPAAVLLVLYVVGIFMDAVRFHQIEDSSFSLFVTASLIAMATLSTAETYLLAVHSVQWMLCVATAVMLRRAVEASRAAADPAGRKPSPPTADRRLTYALVTAARNEAQFIERTLQSVTGQTRTPERWIIVSDGSTDETHAIVQRYAEAHPWIELLPLGERAPGVGAGKARAFNAGYAELGSAPYDVIGNLDADLTFDTEYLSYLVDKFRELPNLGVAGSALIEESAAHYDYRFTNIEHVSGPCQLFRKACLDAIGGYALADVAIDTMAVTRARMGGWQTRTFVEKAALHHRRMDSARQGLGGRWLQRGRKDYLLGHSMTWQIVRGLYQMTRPPVLVRGALISAGYVSTALSGQKRLASREMQSFLRREHTRRITHAAGRAISRRPQSTDPTDVVDLSLGESLFRLASWVEAHDYKGYEPFDGLSSPLRPLTLGAPFLERVLQQAVRRSPFNLRPILGIRPLDSTKGRGYMARGYLACWRQTGDETYRARAVGCLEWLMQHTSPRHRDASWGNHFDFTSRAGRHRTQESIIVWTSLIGQAFLDAYEDLSDERYLDVARSVCDWILKLPREQTPAGACLSYLAGRQLSIHNANFLGAAMLARTARHTTNAELVDVARAAMNYSCAAQRADGSWYYAEPPAYHWIDGFHTGYNLDSIQCYGDSTGDRTFEGHLEQGFRYFREHLVEADGTPRYYHDRRYPIDIQSAAQAIETFANFSDRDPAILADAVKVARWTMRHMQDPAGYFYYRRSRHVTIKTPMLHWGQATMYRALALLALKLSQHERPAAGWRASEPA